MHTDALQRLDRLQRRAAGGDHVFQDDDGQAVAQGLVVLDELLRAVVFDELAHVQRRHRGAALKAEQRNGARERTATELDPGDGFASGMQLFDGVEHQRADETMTLGGEDGLFAVDEEVALFAGGERHAALLVRALFQELDEPLPLALVPAHAASARPCA